MPAAMALPSATAASLADSEPSLIEAAVIMARVTV
jgi:hypothetical protein